MNSVMKLALAAVGTMAVTQAAAEITFYEHEDFRGRTFSSSRDIPNFQPKGFDDRASSVVVSNERWEVCEHADYRSCVILLPGRYHSLAEMGLNDKVSSARMLGKVSSRDDNRQESRR